MTPADLQTADTVVMVRPRYFGANPETAATNAFQRDGDAGPGADPAYLAEVRRAAMAEFDDFVALLRSRGVEVLVIDDQVEPATPDAVFPNNWISLHRGGRLVLYPLLAPSRRGEAREDLVGELRARFGFGKRAVLDLRARARTGRFLEGTGSLVLDRVERVAYASVSPRTDPELAREVAARLGYEPVVFQAADSAGVPVYHTNVVLSIGVDLIVVCLEAMSTEHRERVAERLRASGRELLLLRVEQMERFAANVLQVRGRQGELSTVISRAALAALDPEQSERLARSAPLLVPALETIERHGGGSARCMLLEVFPAEAATPG